MNYSSRVLLWKIRREEQHYVTAQPSPPSVPRPGILLASLSGTIGQTFVCTTEKDVCLYSGRSRIFDGSRARTTHRPCLHPSLLVLCQTASSLRSRGPSESPSPSQSTFDYQNGLACVCCLRWGDSVQSLPFFTSGFISTGRPRQSAEQASGGARCEWKGVLHSTAPLPCGARTQDLSPTVVQ